jgi:hypothetical protein
MKISSLEPMPSSPFRVFLSLQNPIHDMYEGPYDETGAGGPTWAAKGRHNPIFCILWEADCTCCVTEDLYPE